MKKITFLASLFTALIFLFTPVKGYSQWNKRNIKGNGQIVKSSIKVPAFNRIQADGADHIIILTKGNAPYTVITETDENLLNAIHISVKNQTLHITYSNLNPTRLKFYVTVPYLQSIRASGASVVKGADTLSGQLFKLDASGAANVDLILHYHQVNSHVSGAADVVLYGKADKLYANVSGAGEMKAGSLVADSVFAKASGAGEIKINAQKFLNKETSAAASIRLVRSSEKSITVKNAAGKAHLIVYNSSPSQNHWNDTTRVNVGSIHVEVVDGDTTKVTLGSHTLVVDDNGNIKWIRTKPVKFNGHWGGVDLGINGYLTPSMNTDFGKEYEYLNLQYEKSINVNLNLFEQNIPFNKARTIGMVTGLGLSFNNYRFTNPTYLSPDSNTLQGFYMRNVSVRKSKLTLFYLSVPVLFEFQTNNVQRSHRFFISFGMIINARLRTHTKIYFNEANKQYYLEDPATGKLLPGYYTTPNRDNRNIVKSVNSFNLQPFRFDATVRMGYGTLVLYATYAVNNMFLKDQGPDLNQWSAGISISGW
ncbi:DUF2807 domain-containing protein [Candidatus Sulfidibacterium hydrothermale]|uniref:head GIN domain-containing protein n=1 Tax=Candidatus Sulfidibacterium hydrothermale TaxID=2875962 RepID=UPI001F0B0308|nr:head GIN domain-containing protein [Candidatus Sulfidibacterium hydrothermale]UBM61835.1 DUF2807 domain-containing protein [Candidatus Sulfidibacterium hydrothermale]